MPRIDAYPPFAGAAAELADEMIAMRAGVTGTLTPGQIVAAILAAGLVFPAAGDPGITFSRGGLLKDTALGTDLRGNADIFRVLKEDGSATVFTADYAAARPTFKGLGLPILAANIFTANQTIELTNAVTAAVSEVLGLTAKSSGTAAAGFGGKVQFNLQNSVGAAVAAADLDVLWTDPANATKTSKVIWNLFSAGASVEALAILATGGMLMRGVAAYAIRSLHLFSASGTYTKSAGARAGIGIVIGGGGGGGGANNGGTGASAGNGGGGGGIAVKLFTNAGATETVTIGAAGTAGAAAGGTGGNGGTTSIGTLCVATGGTGGGGNPTTSTILPMGGSFPGGIGTTGDILIQGGSGMAGISFGTNGASLGGSGGTSLGGNSKAQRDGVAGDPGRPFGGGGGGGAALAGGGSVAGGAGAAGYAFIVELF